ncbi:hypothetical protein HA402_013250 [Bradysia odoriphaga]|nr:hypothetical protein HA402_013250 [Bradysia odoriphaga]
MATLEKLVLDAKRISTRLNDNVLVGDSLINEIEFINEQLKTLRTVHDKFDLNELSRNKSNQNLAIQKKYPHIQEIQHENRELRACLQDYQRAMEHVMTKYREHTQQKILDSKFTFTTKAVTEDNSKHEQINEMVELMRKAASINEDKEFAEMELINKLFIENQGLREMLRISKEFGSQTAETETEERPAENKCNDKVDKSTIE